MPTMRAVLVEPDAEGHLSLGRVDPPTPLPNEAVVAVRAISLNLGEVRRAATEAKGTRTGWDLAGVIEQPAADGSGPRAGTRVVGIVPRGAWAERVAVRTKAMAALPDSVSFEQAASLPVAGLTALYALDRRNGLAERRVLVTGASGGVGHFACQIARHGGAQVVGLVRRAERVGFTQEAGAEAVVVGEDALGAAAYGPYDLILDSVGGAVFGQAVGMLAPDGVVVTYGVSAGKDVTFDARAFFRTGRATIHGLYLFEEFAREPGSVGLGRLVRMVASGAVVPHIDHEADWAGIGAVAKRLTDRRIAGKAVLRVG